VNDNGVGMCDKAFEVLDDLGASSHCPWYFDIFKVVSDLLFIRVSKSPVTDHTRCLLSLVNIDLVS